MSVETNPQPAADAPLPPNPARRSVRSMLGSKLARAAMGSFGVAIFARAMQLVMAIVLARQLGPAGYGTFTFALGAAILAAQFASLGWPALMARYMPMYMAGRDDALLRGLVRTGDGIVLAATCAVALAMYLFPSTLGLDRELTAGLALAALLTVPMGFRLLRRQQLAALKRPATGLAVDEAIAPTALVLVSLFLGVGTSGDAFLIYSAASLLGVALGTFALWRYLPAGWRKIAPRFTTTAWMAVAFPMVLAVASRVVLNRIDVLMLAPLSTFEEVGLYGACFRLTFLVGFIPHVASTIIWPLIAEHYATGKVAALRRILKGYGLALSAATGVLALVLAVFAEPILFYLFGAEFVPAVHILRLLAAAQWMAACSTVASSLLLMSGRQNIFAFVNLLGVAANVALNLALIPALAAEGAALATLATNLGLFLVLFLVAWRGLTAQAARGGVS